MHNLPSIKIFGLSLALGSALLGGCATDHHYDKDGGHTAGQSHGPLSKTFAAHGGLDKWNAYAQYHFEIEGFPMPWGLNNEAHVIDLRQRRANVRDTGSGYTIQWNGASSQVTPENHTFKGPPDFWAMGPFYFAGMPFVFGDEGVNVTALGRDTFGGKTYDHYKATFSVGYSPKDEYRIWVDPVSHRLKMVEFRVTHPAVQGDKPLSQAIREYLVFNEWKTVDGLVVPAKATFYLSDGKFNKLGDLVGTYTTRGLDFDKKPAADSLFGKASAYGY